MRLRLGLALALIGGLMALATASAISAADPNIASPEVLASVGRFVDTTGARVEGPLADQRGDYFQVVAPAFTSRVDAATGRLLTLTRFDAVPLGSVDKLSRNGAVDVASEFLASHSIDTSKMTLEGGFEDHGGFAEYLLTWQRWDGAVRVPDKRVVAINPSTGEVFQYFDNRRDYAPPPAAAIDEAQGVKIAKGALDGARASAVVFSELAITFSASGEQSLVWEVGLTAANPSGWTDAFIVHVDALSGQATIFAQG